MQFPSGFEAAEKGIRRKLSNSREDKEHRMINELSFF
jgi:hypothetical protein